MNNQESEKSISGKTFPMDLASKPPPTKPMETSGIVKPPLASPLTLRHAVPPNLRVVTTVPALGQHITAGPHLISHIVPQVGIKQVDVSARPHITTIPARSTTPAQIGQNATRTILSTTYQLPRGATTASNVSGPRIRPPVIQSQCQSAAHISAVPSNVIAGGSNLPVGHANTNSVGPIGVTVNVPVNFVRAAVPPRATSPATGTAWIGGTVQVQTVQVCSAQRISTFATVGRSTQSNMQNPRQSLIHQTSQQVNTVKPVSTSGTLSVQTIATGALPARTQQNQSTTLVYGSNVSHASRLHTIPAGSNNISQRVKGINSNTRQIQVSATPRAHITVPAAMGSRISTISAINSSGATCNNAINNPHIVSYANSLPQTSNITMSTTSGISRVAVNNIAISRPIQGQVLTSGNRIAANISNSNIIPQVIQTAVTSANSISNTSTTNIITSTNVNTNNLSSNPPNISGLVQLHPAAVLVASGGNRTNNTKLLAQIAQPGIKTNGSNILQSSIQTIALNSTSCTTMGITNISTTASNTRIGAAVPTRIMTSVPKTFAQTSESNANPYIHRSSPSTIGLSETKSATNSFPISGAPYYYNASYNATTNFSTNSTAPPTTHSVHVTQPVCFNPIMLVEATTASSVISTSEQPNHTVSTSNQLSISTNVPQTSQQAVHTNQGISSSQPSGSLLSVVHHSQASTPPGNQQNVKPTSSPRPSILRKRDHEGLHLKAAKNLTPALHVITNNPPVSPQQRPDSRGNCPSSAGSTTISATSSPGLEDQDEDHKYPLNLEVNAKYVPEQNRERISEDGVKYSGLNEENLRKFNMETKDQVYSIEERMKLNTSAERLHTGIRTNRDFNVLENRYKYENRIHSTNDSDKKINVSLIEGDAFKSTDVNIKHEDSNSRKNLRQDDDRPTEMSPRKKPRKQQLTSNESFETKSKVDDMMFISETHIKHEQMNTQESSTERVKEVTVRKPPSASLLSYYKQSWKSTQYHFQRYSDVKPKDERKPNIIDLANQSHVLQKINGWKIYHLSTQMEDMSEMESQVYEKLSGLLTLIEKEETFQTKKEKLTVNELIKGNMQRSKIINDGMVDAKSQIMRIFDHKANVSDIIQRCASKRNFKKRDKS